MFPQVLKLARDRYTRENSQPREETDLRQFLRTLETPVGDAQSPRSFPWKPQPNGCPASTRKGARLEEQVSQAAVCACARPPRPAVREARMEDAAARRCHGSVSWPPRYRGAPSPRCQSLERGGEASAPGRLCDLGRCILPRQEGL